MPLHIYNENDCVQANGDYLFHCYCFTTSYSNYIRNIYPSTKVRRAKGTGYNRMK